MTTLDRLTSILNEVESVQSRFDEGVSSKEKKDINTVINKPKNQTIKILGHEVKVISGSGNIKFEFDKNDDITFTLVDIADARGLEFKHTKTSNKDIITINL